LGSRDLQKLKGSDLDDFYEQLSRRGLSATSVRSEPLRFSSFSPSLRR
jgi:hypothetical protein